MTIETSFLIHRGLRFVVRCEGTIRDLAKTDGRAKAIADFLRRETNQRVEVYLAPVEALVTNGLQGFTIDYIVPLRPDDLIPDL